MNSFDNKRVLVLGASSWLGYLLVQKLDYTNASVAGTIYRSKIVFPKSIEVFRTENSKDNYKKIIKSFKPTTIINFLRGEDENGFKLHQEIITLSNDFNIHYIYTSSVLALDGYKNTELTESLEAKGESHYGIFKADCERELYNATISLTVLRFSSVQGWAPHKPTRNEVLLRKLNNNIPIKVDKGVMQNRILASLLIEGILDIIVDKVTGIIHFGSLDASEEYSFLKTQATIFGFQPDLVQLNNIDRTINLVTVPYRIFELYGDKYKVIEEDTLQGLLKIEALKQIKGSK